jgi:hypothetical protein
VNPGRSPEWIGFSNPANKISDIRTDQRPPGTFTPGLELPKQLETLSMPPNDSFGFEDDQGLLPIAPESTKQDPEEAIPVAKSGSFGRPFHSGQLLAERKVFQNQIGIRLGSQKYVQDQFQ